MSLFHRRVLDKHLIPVHDAGSRHVALLEDWAKNLGRGIYDSETQNDSVFIQRILVDVLGYVDSSNGQQWTVAKNQPVGSGNVDVALGRFTQDSSAILAPFELKGAKTDLDTIMPGRHKTPVQQAWEYAMDVKGAQWVLVSNYREIRLYAVGYGRRNYESFDLAKLTAPEQYARFILLLSAQNLLGGRTMSLLEASEQADKDITDRFYQEYKDLRSRLIDVIGTDNSVKDKLDCIRHAQTILDRVLFIAFAEDRGLLPPRTLETASSEVSRYNPQPIWKNFVGLFQAINTGKTQLNIPGYNGGLFADDPELNALNISDELCQGFKKIGDYSFDTDISVDILGHIFEQSISDLEELKAAATGGTGTFDKKRSKRKKEGIFYTPSYITHYIVEQAVGGWLAERRKEIGFDALPELTDVDYGSIVKKRQRRKGQQSGYNYNENIKKHIEAWETYKKALSAIKVLDPACGSGAFLTEVFDYLCHEGQTVNNELAKLQGEHSLFRWDTHILANNLYGVDLNQESVEITKLSLWLKTANRKEKLTRLDDNIKVGNSLIDDPAIAGDRAFHWRKEFPQVFDSGGFDVVVGNPPYLNAMELKKTYSDKELSFIKKHYSTAKGAADLYIYFFERGLGLINKTGHLAYITPNRYLSASYGTALRQYLVGYCLYQIINYSDKKVFPDASNYPIITFLKNKPTRFPYIIECGKFDGITKELVFSQTGSDKLSLSEWGFLLNDKLTITQKVISQSCSLKEVGLINATSTTNEADTYSSLINTTDGYKLINTGTIDAYSNTWGVSCLIDKGNKYLNPFLSKDSNIISANRHELYSSPKIIIAKIGLTCESFYDEKGEYASINTNCIHSFHKDFLPEYVLCWLNSRLYNYTFECLFDGLRMSGGYLLYSAPNLRNTYIFKASKKIQNQFILPAKNRAKLTVDLHGNCQRFLKRLTDNFDGVKITGVLECFEELDFKRFLAELAKQKIPIPIKQQAEWDEYFSESVAHMLHLRESIQQTDAEIDRLVYTLYGLTDEEIALVENG